jgi:hypothetical protein
MAAVTPANAGTYLMYQCSLAAPTIAPGWSTTSATTQAITSLSNACGSGGLLGDVVESGGQSGALTEEGSNGSRVGLLLSVPASAPDVSIQSLTARVTASAVAGDDAYLGFSSSGQELPGLTLLKDSSGSGFQSLENWTLPQGARDFETSVYCTTDHSNTTCRFSSASEVPALNEITLTLKDSTPPAITAATGALASAAVSHSTITGSQEIGFTASDADSGVRSAQLTLTPQAGGGPSTHTFEFSAECTYSSWNACPLKRTVAGYNFDTSMLKDGTYNVTLSTTDAAGNTGTDVLGALITHNAPTETALPVMLTNGNLTPATVLSSRPGEWNAPTGAGNITYTYQWETCDSQGNNCQLIAGAQGTTYTLAPSDVGHTIRLQVTASDQDGSTSATSAASQPVKATEGSLGAEPGPGNPAPNPSPAPTSTPPQGTTSNAPNLSIVVAPVTTTAPGGIAPNGNVASRAAVIHLAIGRRITRSYSHRALQLEGRLLDQQGHPISGATLDILAQINGGIQKIIANTKTHAGGAFTVRVPAGPSRTLQVAYRAFSSDHGYAATASVTEAVSAGVRLQITPAHTNATGPVTIYGEVHGPVPSQGALVDVLVHYQGHWEPIRTPRTDAAGHFALPYTFGGGTGRFPFKLRVPGGQVGFPYTRGYSNTIDVTTN